MLRHLFKLIWNKKGSHALLIIEIWASFMVLFGVLSLIVYNFNNYIQPIGFEYDRVWNIQLSNNQDTVSISDKMQRIVQQIKAGKEVESLTRMSSNTPFSANQISNGVTYKKVTFSPEFIYTDENFGKTMNLPVVSGKWYTESDRVSKFKPIVINSALKEKFFENENPLGKVLKVGDDQFLKVVGMVDKFKSKGEFTNDSPAIFELLGKDDSWNTNILIKTKPGTDANFEAKLVKEIAATLPGWGIEVSYLTEQRKNRHNLTLVPVAIFLIVSGFLLTNVALGLFGILNLSIAKRRNEIGLRRAMGATETGVTSQFLGEIWVLAALSVIIGLLFAVQFPIMHVFDLNENIYVMAIIIAIILIFVIVTLCAWWPSRQASQIHPAIALHEE